MKTTNLTQAFTAICIIACCLLPTANCFAQSLSFGINQGGGDCPSYTINFTIYSQPAGTDHYIWDFGDGSAPVPSSATTIAHNYTSSGSFYIILQAYTVSDSLLETQNNQFYVNGAGIEPSASAACPGDLIQFEPRVNNGGGQMSFQWDFGDGTVLSTTNEWSQTHIYSTTGTFNASLSFNDPSCGNITVYRKIVIGSSVTPQLNWINMNTNPICPGDAESFYVNSAGTFNWTFGDGATLTTTSTDNINHIYDTLGDYAVTVLVTNGCGLSASATDTVFVQSNVPISFNNSKPDGKPNPACPNDLVEFDCWNCDNYSKILWNFGDGAVDSSNSRAFHAYTTIGTKFPTLTIYNGCGNDTTLDLTAISIQNGLPVDTNQLQFLVIPDSACAGDPVSFLVANMYAKVVWNFDDGTKDSIPDWSGGDILVFVHSYSILKTYNTTLTVTNGCGNSASKTVKVYVGSNVPVQPADFGEESPMGFGWDEGIKNPDGTMPRCTPIGFFAFSGSTYSWNWGDGTSLVTSSGGPTHIYDSAGAFTITLVTTNSCGNSATFTDVITIGGPCLFPCPFSVNTTTTSASCGNSDGSATVVVSGGVAPYTFLWSNGATTITATGLAAGNHYFQVTDSLACTTSGMASVSNSGISVTATSQNITCNGGIDGSITLTVTGGTAPLTYLWNNGTTANSLSNLSAGSYDYVVKDSKAPQACIATGSISLTQPDAITIFPLSNPATCGNADGSVTTIINGGVAPYTYNWNTGATTSSLNSVTAGNYTLSITDANNCLKTKSIAINNTGGPTLTVSASSNPTCSDPLSGSVTIAATGGAGTFTYSWSNAATSSVVTNLSIGTYSVTVTDIANCIAAISATLTTAPPVNPGICIVTVDSITGKNVIVWEKDPGVVLYNIYKESTQANFYFKLASVPKDSLSIFFDTLADPKVTSWRYRFTTVDSCGIESAPSGTHKTMHLLTNLGLNNEINLSWNGYEGFGFSSYKVYRWNGPGTFVLLSTVPSTNFSYTDLNHPGGVLYYIVVAEKTTVCTATGKLKTYNSSKSNTAAQTAPDGISEVIAEGMVRIYPNPTTGKFEVRSLNPTGIGSEVERLEIYNVLGEKIYSTSNLKLLTSNVIDISSQPPGMYFLQIHDGDRIDHAKIVLE